MLFRLGMLGGRRRATALVAFVCLAVVLSGCAQPKAFGPAPPEPESSGVTDAQLAALRSVPASVAMSGPRVPELFSLEDCRRITGVENIKITAQA